MTLMRATRVGGSFSSSPARACGANKIKRLAKLNKSPSLLRLVKVVVFMTNPLSSEGMSDLHRDPAPKGPSDGSRVRLASMRLNPRTGKKLPFPHGIGTSCRAGANHKTCASVQRVPTVLGAEPWQVNGACSRRDKSSDNSACY